MHRSDAMSVTHCASWPEYMSISDTNGPSLSFEIMKLLEEINERGTTVLVVTHNREIVNAFRKRVITMKKGVIVSDEQEGEYRNAN